MKTYTFSQARQKLAQLLDEARNEDVMIKRRDGDVFVVRRKRQSKSPFDVPGIKTRVTTKEILEAIHEVRSRDYDDNSDPSR